MAVRLQLAAEVRIVVDLAVEDDLDRTVLVPDRLIARLQVDDAQAPHRQANGTVGEEALAIGAAVGERVAHGLEGRAGGWGSAIELEDADDSAHAG